MKVLPIAILLIFSANAPPNSIWDSDAKQARLLGPVELVKTDFVVVKKVNGKSIEIQRTIVDTYDQKGNRVDSTFYDNGSPWQKYVFERELSADGSYRRSIYIYQNSSLTSKVSRLYDRSGIETQYELIKYENGNSVQWKQVISRDSSGAVDEEWYDANDRIIEEPKVDIGAHVQERGDVSFSAGRSRVEIVETDGYGNWTVERNCPTGLLIHRTISYYH